MNKAIIVATAYARSYDNIWKAFKEDPINYVKRLSRSKISSERLKKIVEMHYIEKKKLSDAIPNFIDIGPFRLVTSSVRAMAIKKHEQLADAVLNYFYEQLRSKMDETNEGFLVLMDRIDQKTGNIEDLLEKKLWCRTVPKKIEKLSASVNILRQDWILIASFNRNMNDEDFSTYWSAQAFPQRVMNVLAKRMLDFDVERKIHQENLELDQLKLKTALESLETEIKQFWDESDISKAAAVASNLRKARKALNTYDEYAQLYNKREKLFGLSMTDYQELKKLSNLLAPYEEFWLSYAEFLKYRDRDSFDMDSAQVREMIEDYQKNMLKSGKYFLAEMNPNTYDAVCVAIDEVKDYLDTRLKD